MTINSHGRGSATRSLVRGIRNWGEWDSKNGRVGFKTQFRLMLKSARERESERAQSSCKEIDIQRERERESDCDASHVCTCMSMCVYMYM